MIPIDHLDCTKETFTVVRTGGQLEEGWEIPAQTHASYCDHMSKEISEDNVYIGSYATKRSKEGGGKDWRIFMMNNSGGGHACGWRRVNNFWPSRITDPDEIDEWQKDLIQKLEVLEAEKILKGKDVAKSKNV